MKIKEALLISSCFVMCLSGCNETTAPSHDGPVNWGNADDFAYQLQNPALSQLGNSAYDILIIDYSSNGEESGEWTSGQISALKESPGGPKLLLAYLSIGEAENYRFYWQPDWGPGNPDFIIGENPDWEGNYLVQYWDPDWQQIIFGSPESYLDRIIAQGFDGAYLDKIDSYQDFPDNPDAESRMVDFVIAISNYARTQAADFAIFPQNAEELGEHGNYLAACTGIGREEVYYLATNSPTSAEERTGVEARLGVWKNADKVVLCVDYCNTPGAINDAYAHAEAQGFKEYCTTVELNLLRFNPGHLPD